MPVRSLLLPRIRMTSDVRAGGPRAARPQVARDRFAVTPRPLCLGAQLREVYDRDPVPCPLTAFRYPR